MHCAEAARSGAVNGPSEAVEETVTVISITPHQVPPDRQSWPGRPPPRLAAPPSDAARLLSAGRYQRSQLPSPEERLPTARRSEPSSRQLIASAGSSSRFSPEIREDESEDLQTSGGEGGEYRVEDIKQEIERLERRQREEGGGMYDSRHLYGSSSNHGGGRISTNGSLTLGTVFFCSREKVPLTIF
jgi:hypothetical protein